MDEYNKALFECLERRTKEKLGAVEEIEYDDDSYHSVTLSGEEDYEERFYVTPKNGKIDLGMVHSYRILDNPLSEEKKIRHYIQENTKGCWIEDKEVTEYGVDLQLDCDIQKVIDKPKDPLQACKILVDDIFWDMQQTLWQNGTRIAWKIRIGDLP